MFQEHNPSRPSDGCRAQYINAVWWHNEAQRVAVARKVAAVEKEMGRGTVQTRIATRKAFYRAEEYHQDYYGKQGR
jgi:peptide methionine sulfoxide reductase MsrA